MPDNQGLIVVPTARYPPRILSYLKRLLLLFSLYRYTQLHRTKADTTTHATRHSTATYASRPAWHQGSMSGRHAKDVILNSKCASLPVTYGYVDRPDSCVASHQSVRSLAAQQVQRCPPTESPVATRRKECLLNFLRRYSSVSMDREQGPGRGDSVRSVQEPGGNESGRDQGCWSIHRDVLKRRGKRAKTFDYDYCPVPLKQSHTVCTYTQGYL